MNNTEFAEQVDSLFGYLTDAYAFRRVASPAWHKNTTVTFQSDMSRLRVVYDRGQVFVDMGPPDEEAGPWVDFSDIARFLECDVSGPIYDIAVQLKDYDQALMTQLARLAQLVQRCASPILSGTFTEWESLYRWQTETRAQRWAEENVPELTGDDIRSLDRSISEVTWDDIEKLRRMKRRRQADS